MIRAAPAPLASAGWLPFAVTACASFRGIERAPSMIVVFRALHRRGLVLRDGELVVGVDRHRAVFGDLEHVPAADRACLVVADLPRPCPGTRERGRWNATFKFQQRAGHRLLSCCAGIDEVAPHSVPDASLCPMSATE
ncbi:MAG: hypothetical protein BGO98_08755 [Myxococcales bacterium 68-20]|nr:MAG: hypothetical protein BGO98_08755 [Myxococcales bacterium 68-20]